MELYQLNFHQRLLLPSFWREMLRGGVSPSEGGVQVVRRETSQQILSLFGVRGCSKWKYDVVENGGQPSSLHMFCSLVHVCFYCILISVVATGGWTVIQSCSSGMKGHAALSEK